MKITTVLFDLDGTLLPMDQDAFIRTYFGALARYLAPYGYEQAPLIDAVWRGTEAMVKNDGSRTNEEAFWATFAEITGTRASEVKPLFDAFYRERFPSLRTVCGYTPVSSKLVRTLRSRGMRVALATNPLFPRVATLERIRWAGLEPSDLELFTTYENSVHSKPSPAYYSDIAEALGVSCAECLMVGNDAREDTAAAEVGMSVFLWTDCLINTHGRSLDGIPHGDASALRAFLQAL